LPSSVLSIVPPMADYSFENYFFKEQFLSGA
jgi:hypothetical protein